MTDPRIDAYIAKAQPFARPILTRIRKAVHKACPDVNETIKWGMPAFVHKGPLVGMAAFKAHCAMNFWKASLVMRKAIAKNAKATKAWATFPPSHRREYIEWITEAKTEPTRDRRLATALEWIADGKGRNWKYER
jgi:uncharacterized protein YdhG (YjbR/CyaY superfamily)